MPLKLTIEDSREIDAEAGAPLLDVLKGLGMNRNRTVLAAFVNNRMFELTRKVESDAKVRFVEIDSLDGIRIYQRSASFLLIKAVGDIDPDAKINILHPIANGLYIEIKGRDSIDEEFMKKLEKRMWEIVNADLPFVREEVPLDKAIKIFNDAGKEDKARLMSFRNVTHASIYTLDGMINYFYGYLAPSTGYVRKFSITRYDKGLILHLPSISHPHKIITGRKSKKFYKVFQETLKWRKILEVEDVGMLNNVIRDKRYQEFVHIAEAFQEKKLGQIADTIAAKKGIKVILLSGPSASGKTTFTKRLAIQLRINGLKPFQISMDDYFLDRDKTPKNAKGDHDFESPHAIDIDMMQANLRQIIDGKPVALPKYDFKTGKNAMSGKVFTPQEGSVVLVEGIHGLNPLFSSQLPKGSVFKIYVSPLTEVPLDSHNRIPTTDTRLLRRMIRDFQFRNYSATETIARWPSVREGESHHVFPYQEEADVFFNTALIYEFATLKTVAEPLLKAVTPDSKSYGEAVRLLKFLSYFLPIPVEAVPRHSLLREFLGGSSFEY